MNVARVHLYSAHICPVNVRRINDGIPSGFVFFGQSETETDPVREHPAHVVQSNRLLQQRLVQDEIEDGGGDDAEIDENGGDVHDGVPTRTSAAAQCAHSANRTDLSLAGISL